MNSKEVSSGNLRITESDEQAGSYVRQRMIEYSMSKVPLNRERLVKPIYLTLRDENNMIMGGMVAVINTYWSRCSIDILWIEEKFRNLGYGGQLLQVIEKIATNNNCEFIILNTASFHAPNFYIKYGYELCGTIEGYPTKEHSLYSFKKILNLDNCRV